MTRSTASSRSGSWACVGISYGMCASRIFALARTMRLAMVTGGTRYACAISSVVRPHNSRNVSETCASGESAGWQHVKISLSRSSSMLCFDRPASRSMAASSCSAAAPSEWHLARRRSASMARNRPSETSHVRGLAGTPSRGHCSSAARKASCSASSASSNSPSSRIKVARTRRDSAR